MTTLLSKQKCLDIIEANTTGKGKQNPNFTSLATAYHHLDHHKMVDKFNKFTIRSDEDEIRETIKYLTKHKLVDPIEVVTKIVKTRYFDLTL